jgi:hypothetical protein
VKCARRTITIQQLHSNIKSILKLSRRRIYITRSTCRIMTMTANGEKERRSRTLDVETNSATTVILQEQTPNENVVKLSEAASSATTEVLVWRRPWTVALCLFSILPGLGDRYLLESLICLFKELIL